MQTQGCHNLKLVLHKLTQTGLDKGLLTTSTNSPLFLHAILLSFAKENNLRFILDKRRSVLSFFQTLYPLLPLFSLTFQPPPYHL